MGLFDLFKKKKSSPIAQAHWSTNLSKGMRKSQSDPVTKVYDWKLQETWEDYPTPKYDAIHTYCSVAIEGFDRTFYYRTRNPDIVIGDNVYVPFGRQYDKVVGVVVDMQDFVGNEAPFPLSRTKHIIDKVEEA